jgi:hypothetical protein
MADYNFNSYCGLDAGGEQVVATANRIVRLPAGARAELRPGGTAIILADGRELTLTEFLNTHDTRERP